MRNRSLFFTISILIVLLCGGIALCARSKGYKDMLYETKSKEDVVQLFKTSPDDIEKRTALYIEQAKKIVDEIIAVEDTARTFENTAKKLDELEGASNLIIFAGIVEVLEYTHPDASIRNAAHEALIKIQNFAVDYLSNNTALYRAFKAYAQGSGAKEKLSDEQQYYIQKTMEDFKRSGLDLPDETLAKVKTLKKDLATLCLDFEKNIAQENRTIAVKKDDLAGLEADFIAQLKKNDQGDYLLGTDYPTYQHVMENGSVGTTRKKLLELYANRAYPINEAVLRDIVAKRGELAHLLGFKSFADLDLDDQMVKTVERAEHFLYPLSEKAVLKEKQEFEQLIADLPEGVALTADGKMNPWDVAYAKNYYKKKHYAVNEVEIAEYFPMEKTIQGLLAIYERFLSVKLNQVSCAGLWHEDIKMIEARDLKTDQVLGYLVLDLYPRPNKFTHACHAGVVPATFINDKPTVRVSVVIANFPKSTGTKPALLMRKDVNTFFHEFGHAMHALFGRTQLASFAGTNVKRDFVELPSQMLEEWLYDKEILKMVSGHYQTGKPLSDELIDRILSLKNYSSGAFLQMQLLYSILSLNLFKGGSIKDIESLYKNLYTTYRKHTAYDPHDHMYAAFGHLTSYGPKYYGYLWSRVFALDMFEEIKKHGLLNPEIGSKYISTVIGKGGSQDPNVLLENFLGREPNQEAFLKDMGLALR